MPMAIWRNLLEDDGFRISIIPALEPRITRDLAAEIVSDMHRGRKEAVKY